LSIKWQFKLTCLNCGKEVLIRSRKKDAWKGLIFSNRKIDIIADFGYEELSIVCNHCGNESIEK